MSSGFFNCPRTSQLEKITCPEQQMYDSDNTDNWFRHPWRGHKKILIFILSTFNISINPLTVTYLYNADVKTALDVGRNGHEVLLCL